MHKSKVRRTGMLTSKPNPADIRPQILVHLERRARRPVRKASTGPRELAPAGVCEGDWIRGVGEHLAEDFHDFSLCGGVGLPLNAVGFFIDDDNEEDVGARQKAWCAEGLEEGVVAAGDGVGVEHELGGGVPEGVGELEEDLGVGAHFEHLYSCFLPVWKLRGEGNGFVLKNA